MASYVGSGITISSRSDQSSYTTGTDGGSNYTVGSGSDRLLLIWLIGFTNAASDTKGASAVTHNGQSATNYGALPANDRTWVELWYIKNPTTGSGGTSVTCVSGQRAFITFAEEFDGVDQTTPIHATFDSAGGSGTSRTFTLSPSAGSILSAAVSVRASAGTFSASDGGTLIQSDVTGTLSFNDVSGGLAYENIAAGGSNSLTLSWTTSNNNSGLMVEVLAAAGGGATVSFDTLAYTQTLPDVSVAVDTSVALDALAYTATLPDLTVSVDTPVALDAISYTQTLPDISVAVSAIISLDTISYTLSLPDASVQVDTPVSVDTISYSATLPDIGVAVDTPVNLDALNYAVTLPDITVQTSVTVNLDAIGYTLSLPDMAVSVRSGARGDDAFRSHGARERFWRRKAEEWLEDHLEQTLRATKKKKAARKRAGTRIVAAANAAAAEMPEIAPKIDLIARFAAQLSAPDPDLMAIATAVAAQLEQVETEKRTRRRKRDLEAVLLLAA